jgi:hypothetical protein
MLLCSMGFKYCYNIENAVREIHGAKRDASNSLNDGFIAWGAKQDLLRLKRILDDAIRQCPSFGHTEREWIKEQEQKRIIDILSKDDLQ